MRRREFLGALGGTIASWPIAARAQKALPTIGFLSAQSQDDLAFAVTAFRNGLKEAGYEEGRNVTVEYHWAEGREDRLAALSADLAKSKVAVIASTGGDLAALALKRAGTTIPVVFAVGGDPVALGLVVSLNRPGGNFTGVTQITVQLDPKRLEALHELVPSLDVVAVLRNPANANAETQVAGLRDAARAMNIQLQFATAATEQEIDAAFTKLEEQRVGALMVASDPFFNGRRHQILPLAAKLAVPTIFHQREFTLEGALMSYGTRVSESYRRVAIYAGRILKGERVGELPVQQGTNVELVVNLKTAKRLNVTVPQTILARADEIIE